MGSFSSDFELGGGKAVEVPGARRDGWPRVMVAMDFEIGDAQRDSACALALVRCEGGAIVRRWKALLKPPRPIRHTWIHGIDDAAVRNAPTFAEAWPAIAQMLDGADAIAAHSAFDGDVMRRCCDAARIPVPRLQYIDTMLGARRRWNLRPTRLPDVCAYLGIPLTRHHDPLCDAEAAAEIALRLFES